MAGTHRKMYNYLLFICFCLLLSGCASEEAVSEADYKEKITVEEGESIYSCTKADLKTDAEEIKEIDLSALKEDFVITDAGNYMFIGDYNGQIYIDAEEQIVHLFLKNVDIYSLSGSAIDVLSAGKVIITLVENTENTIRDSAHNRDSNKRDAAIYSDCDLTINGAGSLNLYGFYNDAIHSKDIVKVLGGEIFIQAKGNGIQGNDGLLIAAAQLQIECEGTALCSTKTGKSGKGTIDICGGEVSIIAGKYAVTSAHDLYMRNCTFWSNSILGELNVAGEKYIAEGCMENE